MTRVGLIDDHEMVSVAVREAVQRIDGYSFAGVSPTVSELLRDFDAPDIVILDLRLADGSSPVTNVDRLERAGSRTIIFTSGESPYLLRSVAKAQVYGIIRKSAPLDVLVECLRRVVDGEAEISPEWAAAMETDPAIESARLSAQEQLVLEHLANGLKAMAIGHELGIATATVDDYIRRIRAKYQRIGRPAHTRIDLYKRAVEDGILPPPSRQ